jgi:hypothetical protein
VADTGVVDVDQLVVRSDAAALNLLRLQSVVALVAP